MEEIEQVVLKLLEKQKNKLRPRSAQKHRKFTLIYTMETDYEPNWSTSMYCEFSMFNMIILKLLYWHELELVAKEVTYLAELVLSGVSEWDLRLQPHTPLLYNY